MPAILANYEVLLIFNNDTQSGVTVELQRTYGQNRDSLRLVSPEDSVTLILDAGAVYRYSIKKGWNVAEVTVQSWRDVRCNTSHLFSGELPGGSGITVDRVWQDYRCYYYPQSEPSRQGSIYEV
ncbi:hypothetical protein AX15_006652 [Amanita polypyramis BW_CC]|nr:hypothetical protein AX15_006652 [Amanita polypyramis BW_CC]